MSENHKIKIRNNLQINFHNHISKPSYLITINPDKFLQKSAFNTAMSIKERDELNPEMAEIVRKILLKRKKEKNPRKNNNLSFKKERKDHSLKKYLNDNYNKKQDINKDNYFNNQELIFDSLNDRVGADNKNVKYFDYINKNVNNKIKIIRKKRSDISYGSHSVPRYKNKSIDEPKFNPCLVLNNSTLTKRKKIDEISPEYGGLRTEYDFNKKLNRSLDLKLNQDYNDNKENDNYSLKLNTITLDEDKINRDESIMEIKCDYSYNNIISPRDFEDKRNNKSDKKKVNLKKIKLNYINNKNIGKDPILDINSINKKFNETARDFNKKVFSLNKKNNIESNYKYPSQNKTNNQINKNKANKLFLNKSQERRNKNGIINVNQINNNINNQFNLTITNNFFKSNLNIHNINNTVFNNKKLRLNHSANKRDKNINIIKTNMKFEKMNSKKSYNNVSRNLNMNINRVKASPFHSKNSSNISTEFSHNNKNKKTRKIKNNDINKIKNSNQNSVLNNKKKLNEQYYNYDYMKKKLQKGNINKEIQSNTGKKAKSKQNISIKKEKINLINQKLLKDESNKSLNIPKQMNFQKSNKKEYPNMAYFKNRETKYIKKIESLCKKGYSGPGIKKTNQDNFFIYNNFNNNSNYVYLGVCDGHGLFGQDISTYLVNNLPHNMNKKIISKNLKNLSNTDISLLSTLFRETFVETNISLNSDERIDSSYSGSTCASILFTPNKLCCINVGDSRCILGKFVEKNKSWIPINLSRDHKPSEPDEMNRIKKCGGIVESYRDNFGNFVGPERVWGPGMDGPGLAMSRSFGDEIGHGIGVVVDPEILEHFFEKEDKFIVLGSDGIWEFISNEEVVNIVKDYYLENNIEGAIETLYNEASKRWIMEEEVIDDITIIIIFLN